MHLACGLSVGLTGLAAGYAIGVVGDSVCHTRSLSKTLLTWTLGCSGVHATIESVRWHDINSDFWRSPRALRVRQLSG